LQFLSSVLRFKLKFWWSLHTGLYPLSADEFSCNE